MGFKVITTDREIITITDNVVIDITPQLDGVKTEFTTPTKFKAGTLFVSRNGMSLCPDSEPPVDVGCFSETGENTFKIGGTAPDPNPPKSERVMVQYTPQS